MFPSVDGGINNFHRESLKSKVKFIMNCNNAFCYLSNGLLRDAIHIRVSIKKFF